jgi:hypothetical protein
MKKQTNNGYFNCIFSLIKSSTISDNKKTSFEQNEEWETRKQQMLAVSIALTAMIAYAFAIGFIKVDIIKTDLEYSEKN